MYGDEKFGKTGGNLFQIVDNVKQPIQIHIFMQVIRKITQNHYTEGVSKSLLFETPSFYIKEVKHDEY